ncbi:NAD(P)-binding protein [Trichocladium antarcticum]|uniref:NAD(P)-binding protein n=1 Tax=Trichocladium antarcticum TaxID=1450529 RepID=A0AAN6UCE2_9PEZI|nr:NAD(P)-binding protein [Trichocladium antarcticum]
MTSEHSKRKVLLTGGTGFIASHVLDCLLDHGFEVVVTARSDEKGHRIVKSIDESLRKRVSFVVVENIAKAGVFDNVFKSDPTFDYVVHTASPFQFHWDDPVKDCLDPAIKGTTGILKSIHAYAPNVKRVVITSSSAAIRSPPNHPEVYDESCWSDVTLEEAILDPKNTYRASKKFAEQAAWSFLMSATPSPTFSLATINNSFTLGPIPRSLPGPDALNTSNRRVHDLVHGHWRDRGVPLSAPVFTFVDVRDVALAHVRAMMVPEAGGKRFYVVGGFFSNPRLLRVVRERFPRLEGRLPAKEEEAADDFPEDHWGFDNSRSIKVLGLEYRGLEECVADTVESMLRLAGEELE